LADWLGYSSKKYETDMAKILIFILLATLLAACSVTGRIARKYEGKGVEILYKEMGSPATTRVLENGNTLFEYQKETFIKETVIGTGRGTLDPKISPSFIKVETYWFEVDKNGMVVHSDYQKRIAK
jgi:hypothetical protein